MSLQCVLGKCQPVQSYPEQVKRDGWRKQQILVVALDDARLNWLERESVRQIGERLYGERKGNG